MAIGIRSALFRALALAGWAGGVSAAALDVSLVSDSGWRTFASEVAGWETTGFDDAAWSAARAPYPSPVAPGVLMPGTSAQYIWHDPTGTSNGTTGPNIAYFRRSFSLTLPAAGVPLAAGARVSVDDDYELYVNGTRVFRNADEGFADRVDYVGFAAQLRNGVNVIAIRAVDGGMAAPWDRSYERVLFDGRIQEQPTLVLNNVPIAAGQVATLASGDTLQVSGSVPQGLTVQSGGILRGMTDLQVPGQLVLLGGQVITDTDKTVALQAAGALLGHGVVDSAVQAMGGSRIEVHTGDLKLGTTSRSGAVSLGGAVQVQQDKVLELRSQDKSDLTGTLELQGGKVKGFAVGDAAGALQVGGGGRIRGHGSVESEVKTLLGSSVEASTGDLKLGTTSRSGAVSLGGDVTVKQDKVLELRSQDKSDLTGTLELQGGKVKGFAVGDAAGALQVGGGGRVHGHGSIEGEVKTLVGSSVQATTGDLKLGTTSRSGAVSLGGAVQVQQDKVLELRSQDKSDLTGTLELLGGKVKAFGLADTTGAMQVGGGGRVHGHGSIEGEVKTLVGSSVQATTGDLKLGTTSRSGAVSLGGDVTVKQDKVLELRSQDKSDLTGTLELQGGKAKGFAVGDAAGAMQVGGGGRVHGHGSIEGEVKTLVGSSVQATTGDLKLGTTSRSGAVSLGGDVTVKQDKVLELRSQDKSDLTGTLELQGGKVKGFAVGDAAGAMQVGGGGRVHGHGSIEGEVKTLVGSSVQATTGDLKLGTTSRSGAVSLGGDVTVKQDKVLELRSQDKSDLTGTLELQGGKVKAFGLADTTGAMQVGGGGGVHGHGSLEGKVKTLAGSDVRVTGGDMKIGTTDQAEAVDIAGSLRVEARRMLELQSQAAAILRGVTTLDEESSLRAVRLLAKQAAVLQGNGKVVASTVNEGRIRPGASIGTLSFGDELDLTETSRMEFEFGRTVPGGDADHDRILIDGGFHLDGGIELVLFDDFAPQAGEFYDIAVAAHIDGTPDFVREIGARRGHVFDYSIVDLADGRQAFRLMISDAAIPAPGTLGLLLAGAGALWLRRRGGGPVPWRGLPR
jgi:hypothetical protein